MKCSAEIFWAPVEARADAQMGHLHLIPVASAHLGTRDYAHAALDGARVAAGISDLQQLHDRHRIAPEAVKDNRPPRGRLLARLDDRRLELSHIVAVRSQRADKDRCAPSCRVGNVDLELDLLALDRPPNFPIAARL